MPDSKRTIQLAFASGSEDLVPTLLEKMRQIRPDLELWVVSEFRVDTAKWIPYPMGRSWRQNLAMLRWSLRDTHVALAGLILQPRMPYWPMRWVALVIGGLRTIYFNENLDHFMLHPRSAGTIVRHLLWRARNILRWELRPGGTVYTLLWRLWHPRAFARPLLLGTARLAGRLAAWQKAMHSAHPLTEPRPSGSGPPLQGISVVVPSRNGRSLLAELLPGLSRELSRYNAEVIVVDNGSDDGSAELLARDYPAVLVVRHDQPLSFARAINAGVTASSYSHLLMLNNDMLVEPGFFPALLEAFRRVPDLFCATAQILFPEGQRRQETGKAVMPTECGKKEFPVRCDEPVEGEDHTYVLYGSGGCSLFDAAKLKRLGGLDEIYEPAYVEDLDLGFRGWQQGWPTVFVAGARVVHKHRATTSRYYTELELARVLEINYLRFLARTVQSAGLFARMWRHAIERLNLRAAEMQPDPAAVAALRQAWQAPLWRGQPVRSRMPEEQILAIGSGEVTVFPGRGNTGKPVVLLASPYLPYPLSHGGAVRMYNLMREAARDCDQILVAFTDEAKRPAQELLSLCSEIVLVKRRGSHLRPLTARPDVVEEFSSSAFAAALQLMVKKWHPQIAQLEFTQMAQYAEACRPARTVLVEHDVTLDLYAQLLRQGGDWETRQQYERWERFERNAWKQVDAVVTMSEKDSRMVDAAHVVCLENGVDLDRFQPSDTEPEPARLLFIGSFAHLPNMLAVDWFLREAWPHLEGKLHIIAGTRHDYYLERYREHVQWNLDVQGLELEGFVPDPREAYRRASVVIAPLIASAGTNIKIMEAMAMGKAVVSTPAGINGLDDLRDGVDVAVAGTGAEMADRIRALVADPDKRRGMEQQARRTVERRYGWSAIGARQKAFYESLRPRTA